jgi:hypothetical protein
VRLISEKLYYEFVGMDETGSLLKKHKAVHNMSIPCHFYGDKENN